MTSRRTVLISKLMKLESQSTQQFLTFKMFFVHVRVYMCMCVSLGYLNIAKGRMYLTLNMYI